MKTPVEIIKEYINCIEKRPSTVNKKRKELEKQIQTIQDNYKFIETEKVIIIKHNEKQKELEQVQMDYYNTEKYIDNNTLTIINMLEKDGFINKDETNEYKLSQKGILATHLREIHCLIFANLFQNNF